MVEITSLSRVDRIVGERRSTRLVAYFDVTLTEVQLVGCALVVYKNGKVSIWPPRFPRAKDRTAVHLIDEHILRKITDEAVHTFRAMGGTDDHLTPIQESPLSAPVRAHVDPALGNGC